MNLVDIGFGNVININRVIAIVLPDSAPVKRMIQLAKDKGLLIDASCGKSTKAVVVVDSGHIILAAIPIDVISSRVSGS